MDLIKITSTLKTIKIEFKNSDNFSLDLCPLEMTKEEKSALHKLYIALDFVFKKDMNNPQKNNTPLNQTNIIDQIKDITGE